MRRARGSGDRLKRWLSLVLPCGLAACGSPLVPAKDLEQESAALADRFQAELQSQLQAALQAGGPVAALGVCQQAAPAIAARLAQESGAQVRRVSLRPRNPAAAVSGETARQLQELAAAPLDDAGQPQSRFWTIGTDSGAQAHYLRAIPMREQPCAACHGTAIEPAVRARVAELYPADQATGFKPGDLRGAIAISWPLAAR